MAVNAHMYMTREADGDENGELGEHGDTLTSAHQGNPGEFNASGVLDLPLPQPSRPPPVNARYMIPTPQMPRQPIYRQTETYDTIEQVMATAQQPMQQSRGARPQPYGIAVNAATMRQRQQQAQMHQENMQTITIVDEHGNEIGHMPAGSAMIDEQGQLIGTVDEAMDDEQMIEDEEEF